jgi:hypothetical protein
VQINPEEIPQYLRTEFFRKFTTLNPEDVQWYKIGDEYEARFNYQNTQTIFVMSYAGKWIRTESKINDTDLPRITQEYIKKNYPDATIKEAYMVQSDVLPGYKVILSKNQQDEIFNFDKSGNILTNTQSSNKKPNADEKKYKQKISIQTSYLPPNIEDNLYLSYRGFTIKKLYWAKDNLNNDYYIIELVDETGSSIVELEYDFFGNQISQTIKNIEIEKQETKDKKSKKTELKEGVPETAVPKAAVDYFKKKEKRVDEIKWDTLKNHYIVTYLNTVRGYRCSMEFDEKGTWLQTTVYEDTKNLNPMMSKFINDNSQMLLLELEHLQKIGNFLAPNYKKRLSHKGSQSLVGHLSLAFDIFSDDFFCIEYADDIINRTFINGNPRVAAVHNLIDNVLGIIINIDGGDILSCDHNLLRIVICKIKGIFYDLIIFFFYFAAVCRLFYQ